MASFPARDFYDQLAEDYHLIYADWPQAVSRQGAALGAQAIDRAAGDRH